MTGIVEASLGVQAFNAGAGRQDRLGGLPWCPLLLYQCLSGPV